MGNNPFKKCINPACNLTYEINNNILVCKCGSFLDIIYKNNFSRELIQVFYQRRNQVEISTMRVEYGDFEN